MKRTSFAACLYFLIVWTGPLFAEDARIALGIIAPLSGPAASMGQSLEKAIRLADVKSISLHMEDDQCDPKKALASYHKLHAVGVRVYYLACSGSIMAVAPIARDRGELIVTAYAGSAAIRDTGTEVIRFNPDAISIGEAIVQYLTRDSTPPRKVAILYEEQEYASSLADLIAHALKDRLVGRQAYTPRQNSFQAEILSLVRARPDAIVFIPVSDVASPLVLRQLQELRFKGALIGEVNLCDYKEKPSAFGLHGHCYAARFSNPGFSEFERRFEQRFGSKPAYPFYDAITYDVAVILDELAATTTDVAQLKQRILNGVRGRVSDYTFSAHGELLTGSRYLSKVTY